MTKSVKRLYETFQPEHYNLHIIPSDKTMYFTGSVEITGKKIGRPSRRLTFHQNGLKITKTTITKHDKKGNETVAICRINTQNTLHEVRLHTDDMLYPGQYTVYLEFEAPITTGMAGLYPCFFNHEDKRKSLLMTQLESHHAREVFPCIDEPEAKATFDLSLTHPSNYTALSNMPIKDSSTEASLTTTTFDTTPRMSTYLLAFVTGELHKKTGKTKAGIEVGIWGTIAQPEDRFDFALESAIQSNDYFVEYFKVPFPLPKVDYIAVPDFSAGAMENWGLMTFREVALLLDPKAASQSAKELIAEVIGHETSHQWFGDLVTMKWWDDLWLNESFANMMAFASVHHSNPTWGTWEEYISSDGLAALRRDAVPGVQSVKIAVHHPDEISTIFDPSIVYAKGGRLLYMLKKYIGEDAFQKGLQEYFKKHAYQNTIGTDLWAALSRSSQKNISEFMNPWLERSGFPVLTVTQKGKQLTISQEHFSDNPDKADKDRVWPVPLFANRPDVPDLLDTKSITTTLDTDDFVLINREGQGHYIVRYTEEAHRTHVMSLVKAQKISTIDRLMLLNDSSMLGRAGYQPFVETLELLESYVNETEESVWGVMSLVIADARRFVEVDESLEANIKGLVRKLIEKEYKRLGWDEKDTDSPADQKLRATILGLGAYAENTEIILKAKELFEAYKDNSAIISAELRGIPFTVAVKENIPGAVDYLLELYRTANSSDLQRDISGALTATRSTDAAQKQLKFITKPEVIKPQDADRWVFLMLRNRHIREIAWQWMEDNWQWIEDTYKSDKSWDYWPRYAASTCATKQWQDKFIAFFTPKLAITMLKRNIEIGFEEIDNRINWLNRDLAAVQKFFKQ